MTVEGMEELYKQHEGILRQKALSFSQTTGRNFDDLMSEANWAFLYAVKTWDGKRKFNTWLQVQLRGFLINICRKVRLPEEFDPDLLPAREPDPYRRLCWKEKTEQLLKKLSKEARHVVTLLLEGPSEALGIIGTEPPKVIRGAIHKYLLTQGLTHAKSWEILRELKEAVE